ELQPFYGGTYFPPTSRWGRPGFVDILTELARLWRDERPRVREAATSLTARLREATSAEAAPSDASGDEGSGSEAGKASAATHTLAIAGPEALSDAVDAFRHAFDPRQGGFGGAPKFPRPSELSFLLHEFARGGEEDAKTMAVETLRAMALGGMRD